MLATCQINRVVKSRRAYSASGLAGRLSASLAVAIHVVHNLFQRLACCVVFDLLDCLTEISELISITFLLFSDCVFRYHVYLLNMFANLIMCYTWTPTISVKPSQVINDALEVALTPACGGVEPIVVSSVEIPAVKACLSTDRYTVIPLPSSSRRIV